MVAAFNEDTDLGDVAIDPKKFGLPTFEEFAANPDKWRISPVHWLNLADNGQSLLRNVKYHTYKFKAPDGRIYDCASEERVQEVADNEGIRIADCKICPELRETNTVGYFLEVTFVAPQNIVVP